DALMTADIEALCREKSQEELKKQLETLLHAGQKGSGPKNDNVAGYGSILVVLDKRTIYLHDKELLDDLPVRKGVRKRRGTRADKLRMIGRKQSKEDIFFFMCAGIAPTTMSKLPWNMVEIDDISKFLGPTLAHLHSLARAARLAAAKPLDG